MKQFNVGAKLNLIALFGWTGNWVFVNYLSCDYRTRDTAFPLRKYHD